MHNLFNGKYKDFNYLRFLLVRRDLFSTVKHAKGIIVMICGNNNNGHCKLLSYHKFHQFK